KLLVVEFSYQLLNSFGVRRRNWLQPLAQERDRLHRGGGQIADCLVSLARVLSVQGGPERIQYFSGRVVNWLRPVPYHRTYIPNEDGIVLTRGGQGLTIRGKVNRADKVAMASEAAQFLAGGGVPDAHRVVFVIPRGTARGGQQSAIGRYCHRMSGHCM